MVVRASTSRVGETLAQVAAVSLEVGDCSQVDDVCHPVVPPSGELASMDLLRQANMEVDTVVGSELWDRNPGVSTVNSSGSFHDGAKFIDGFRGQILIGQEDLLSEIVND